jgi:biotin operon repressor/anti-sigma regulatory factor (Ser/Thr protein kinase)
MAEAKLRIFEILKKHSKPLPSSAITKKLGLSRQMVSRHLNQLVEEGKVVKSGSTRNAKYQVATKASRKLSQPQELHMIRKLKGLHEEDVFSETELRMNLKKLLPNNVHSIAYYAFTEMLNNAIDHSDSDQVDIKMQLSSRLFQFQIRDYGVGVFKNVQQGFGLDSEFEATQHVFKGKQTTAPEAHSGQGLFFTSRIADQFALSSHKAQYRVDNKHDEKVLGDISFLKGTLVEFSILKRSRKKLDKLFADYADANFDFDRSDVRVRISEKSKLISRSQAKRLMAGLEEYKIITLDFANAHEIGQGFADEIFRVFQNRNPSVQLVYKNASPATEFMIERAKKHRS